MSLALFIWRRACTMGDATLLARMPKSGQAAQSMHNVTNKRGYCSLNRSWTRVHTQSRNLGFAFQKCYSSSNSRNGNPSEEKKEAIVHENKNDKVELQFKINAESAKREVEQVTSKASKTDTEYVARRQASALPAINVRAEQMRMTPARDEVVEEGYDSVSDRVVPKWPLSRESFPTLQLHTIRTPRVSKTLNFSQLMTLLERSKEPEVLLYQSEPHRLYFIVAYSLAFVCLIYGLLFLDWALRESYRLWIDNLDDLPKVHNAFWFGLRNLVSLAVFAVPSVFAYALIMFPTRLIRKMWYIPSRNKIEPHVRFVVHPLVPRSASPVITLPLSKIDRGVNSGKTKVWTGDGLYGTASKSQFMIFLFEKGSKIPWVVDRQGWFWGDGRVWDVIFGKDSVEEAERGISGDDQIRISQAKAKQAKLERTIKKTDEKLLR
ncbi:hypothetical protein V1514DRAFT_323756 [Lipomyces japonicus]|uniref:uncharacterized protein n=1 Tax=Lipomyces japonicus TaxID=56871 RepID=UPI0034CF9846